MNMQRREALKAGGGLGLFGLLAAAGLITPSQARAEWNKSAFDAKTIEETLKALGATGAQNSTDIQITAPDIAENGAVVPLVVTSTLPGTDLIAILVEKNPNTLAATFAIPAGTEPFVSTRVKMGETSAVYAAVRANGKWVMTSKEVKVTLGGCGG
jgi:sulfur-oxidizing protein SoxY